MSSAGIRIVIPWLIGKGRGKGKDRTG